MLVHIGVAFKRYYRPYRGQRGLEQRGCILDRRVGGGTRRMLCGHSRVETRKREDTHADKLRINIER